MHYQTNFGPDLFEYLYKVLGIPSHPQPGVHPVTVKPTVDEAYIETSLDELLLHPLMKDIISLQSPTARESPGGSMHMAEPAAHTYSPRNNQSDSYTIPQFGESAQYYNQISHTVPLNSTAPISDYADSSQNRYLDTSMYHTDRDSHTYSYASSRTILPYSHINSGQLNLNSPPVYVKQNDQQLDLPTSNCSRLHLPITLSSYEHSSSYENPAQAVNAATIYPRQTRPYPTNTSAEPWESYSYYSIPSVHPQPQAVQQTAYTSQRVATPPLYPAAPTHHSQFTSTPYTAEHDTAALYSSQYEYPSRDEGPSQYAQVRTSQYPSPSTNNDMPTHPSITSPSNSRDFSPSSFFPSPPYPVAPLDTHRPVISNPSRSRYNPYPVLHNRHRHHIFPSHERPRSPQAVVIPKMHPIPAPDPASASEIKVREPSKHGELRSTELLERYIPMSTNTCQLCGTSFGERRTDKILEHLLSSHVFQVLKNVEVYDQELLDSKGRHLVTNAEQFAYARAHMNEIRCHICQRDKALVLREENMKKHVRTHRGKKKEDREDRDAELERVTALFKRAKEDWYNYCDMVLYHFPPPLVTV